jgi:asparagine synthase (glutamine-hydrolysing)
MVEAIAAWGVAAAVGRFRGMFALAAWDREERRLHLVRDRLGVKPLYYGRAGSALVFGSELKALRAHPGFVAEIDRDALAAYLRHGYVPAPRSIYRGVSKLLPGTILSLSTEHPDAAPVPYWSLREAASRALADPFPGTEDDAVERLDELLRDAVRGEMVADVPLGAFLSGGVDSSTVVALMQAQSTRPVKSFTIGFAEPGYDEASHARAVARHLGTEHTELRVEPAHALAVVPRLAEWYDEPFADSSEIPTALVAEMTRRHVTVSLSGDGGDELFAGYDHYPWVLRAAARMKLLPRGFRRLLGAAIGTIPAAWVDRAAGALPGAIRPALAGDRLLKVAESLDLDGADAVYRRWHSHWLDPASLVAGAEEFRGVMWDAGLAREIPDPIPRMQLLDALAYLPDDVLTKVDRATMAFGLEARVPLLDHRVVELAWRLPLAMKIGAGEQKRVLRRLLHRYVPPALVERPKRGFAVPIDAWLRGPLRDWAEGLLDPKRLRDGGLLDPEPIRTKWREHVSGARNWQYLLWDVVVFEAWRERWM